MATFIPETVHNLHRRATVAQKCPAAFLHWKAPSLISVGTALGAVELRKVVTTCASLSGWTDLVEIRSSCRRSLHIASAVPYVILAGKQRCTAGNRRTGPPIAECASLHVSSPQSELHYSSRGERENGLSMILITPRWTSRHSLADIIQLLSA